MDLNTKDRVRYHKQLQKCDTSQINAISCNCVYERIYSGEIGYEDSTKCRLSSRPHILGAGGNHKPTGSRLCFGMERSKCVNSAASPEYFRGVIKKGE